MASASPSPVQKATLTVDTNRDAEVSIFDGTLTRVDRAVGQFSELLDFGLYKVRVNRGGELREQVVELGSTGARVSIYVSDFPAVAPIGSMLADQGGVEDLARAARRRSDKPGLLVLGHWPGDEMGSRAPFSGLSVYPWRAKHMAIDLARHCRDRKTFADGTWGAVSVPVEARGDTYVLEMRNGSFVARHAVPLARNFETRIFLRGLPVVGEVGASRPDGPPCAVSIQMAPREQSVVYWDHWESIEVARRALENGRTTFDAAHLVEGFLDDAYPNPIAGMTGLHLLLDSLAEGSASLDPLSTKALADTVLEKLTALLQPGRRNRLYADPAWPELPDMTALRIKAGRAREQVEVFEPPLFHASWEAIKAHAASDGMSWIGKRLWSETGNARRLGPYLAWIPRRHSAAKTVDEVLRQQASLTSGGFGDKLIDGGWIGIGPTGSSASDVGEPGMAELARAYNLPLSILAPNATLAVESEYRVQPNIGNEQVGA